MIVDIIAPASGSTAKETYKSYEFAKQIGLIPRISKDIHCANESFLANNDEYRINDFKRALYSDDSNIIWCLRGGYGTARIMNELIKLPKPTTNKILIGFSDITNLHILFNQFWGVPSLHAPVLLQVAAKIINDESVSLLKDFIFNGKLATYNDIKALNASAKCLSSDITGKIIGGNISIIQTTLATKWQIKTKDKLLFLEDVGIKGYALDRMLIHLKDSGIFDGLKAIIFGDITGVPEKNGDILTPIVIENFAKSLNLPVFKVNGIGHEKTNNPLMLNTDYQLLKGKDSFTLSPLK